MSKKPLKKSEQKNVWKRARRDLEIIINPEYHLIVTEGTKTEPQYFEGLKKEINDAYPNRIDIRIEGGGDGLNTKTLIDKAVELQKESAGRYQHIWVVFDKDDFPNEHFNEAIEKCKELSNDDVTYHALWSNQCIELWFLLHFCYFDSDLHRTEYYPKLSAYLNSKYKKNRKDLYSVLRCHLDVAIKNSKRLVDYHGGKSPADKAPATTVHEIFEKLDPYLKQPND